MKLKKDGTLDLRSRRDEPTLRETLQVEKTLGRRCNICQDRVLGGRNGLEQHGLEHHPGHYLSGKNNWVFLEKAYWCPPLNQWFNRTKQLFQSLKAAGWTNEQYYLQYGEKYLPETWARNQDAKLGNARNEPNCLLCGGPCVFEVGKTKWAAFCSLSCSTKWHAENTDRVERAQATLRERQAEDPDLQLRPNQLRYWTNQGLTEEEARERVKARQSVNTLERFIERASGDVAEGTQAWLDRQAKWLESLKTSGLYQGYSTVSTALFEQVAAAIPDILHGDHEARIRCHKRVYRVDCLDPKNGKIIEFFGDYWHANPAKYKSDDMIKGPGGSIMAKDQWDRDARRVADLQQKGHEVLVIWEAEYRADPVATVKRCIEFLAVSPQQDEIQHAA